MLINLHTHHTSNHGLEIVNSPTENATYYSYGVAPFEINQKNFEPNKLDNNQCIAIGEIGLDKQIQVPIYEQLECFKKQLTYSEKLNLPVIIHCVKAYNELIQLKKEIKPTQPWIIHGFRKTNLCDILINNGFYLSIGTAVLYDEKLQKTITNIPNNRLFLETDNDQTHTIEEVYACVASLKEISLLDLKDIIKTNFINTFKRWETGLKEQHY